MSGAHPQNLVLAIYPFSRGFAFVFFEAPDTPFEWGVKVVKEKHRNVKTMDEIKKLVDRYRPEVLVIEETRRGGARRTSRIRKLYRMLMHLAEAEYIDLYRCRKCEVSDCFSTIGARTKHEIAKAIANQIPAFSCRLPHRRKWWMDSDPRQSLFDAIALAVAYYRQAGRGPCKGRATLDSGVELAGSL